jgi:glycosyltransferase involved in cell wall biosynthesis
MFVVLFREGFDVVQICNPPDLLILVAVPFKLLGKKIIFDQHDLSPEIYQMHRGGHNGPCFVLRALLCFERITYAFADVVLVVNESCRRIAIGRGSKNERDVFVVRNGPSAQSIGSVRTNLALKHGMPHLISYVGMMGPQEGIDALLRAIRDLLTVHGRNDFHVLIMGSGTVLDSMRRYASELGLAEVVTFAGHVEYSQVMEGIATASICVCPDPKTPLNDKCSFVKVVEYMSLGRTLVAFDLEEVRNMAGDAALYAEPNDESDFAAKINRLLDDPDLRTSMGDKGRDRVLRSLTWEHSKSAFYAAYDKVFGNGGAGR